MAITSVLRKTDSLEIRKFISDIKNHEIYFKKNKMKDMKSIISPKGTKRFNYNESIKKNKNYFLKQLQNLISILYNFISFTQNKSIVFTRKDLRYYHRIIEILMNRNFHFIDTYLDMILRKFLSHLSNKREHLRSIMVDS